ncbi:MAG: heavy metal translocating P-type ATPase [Bacilli bacterium]|nr:heavy metal translocating P-type ATPase [Bacilli bacterium]
MKKKYYVEGMTCAACVAHVEKAVSKIKDVDEVSVNLFSKELFVDAKCDVTDKIINNVSKAGYLVVLEEDYTKEEDKKDYKKIKLIISIIASIVLMYFAMGSMMGLPVFGFMKDMNNAILLVTIQIVLALIVIVLNFNYFLNGFKKLFILNPNMDSLIAIGSSCSFIFSMYSFILICINKNDLVLVKELVHNLYFDSSAMILALVSLGKFLEGRSTKKTQKAISDLVKLVPETALLCDEVGNYREVLIKEIKENDIVLVKQGMIIPVDGIIVSGSGSIDESSITGESVPVFKEEGMEVISSSIIQSGSIKVRALKVMGDTTISKIIKLVDEASNSKAPISRFADKVAGIFAFIVIGIALIAFSLYMLLDYGFEFSLNIAISVLVISCPCALGLATPVAIMVGTGVAAKHNFLIKSAAVLENANKLKHIIFDKTGTLTYGKPEVLNVINYHKLLDEDILTIAYSLELLSSHPFALAIVNKAKEEGCEKLEVNNFETIEGVGISGEINGKIYYAGNLYGIEKLNNNLLNKEERNQINQIYQNGSNVIIIYTNDLVLGLVEIKDKVKDNCHQAIDKIKLLGIEPIMVTGDKEEVAKVIANEVGINKVISQVLPQDKARIIREIKEQSDGLVGMVGDGVNDAIALVESDVAIAIGSGTDVAIDSADIVLLTTDLMAIYYAIKLSKRVMKTIKLNLFWAFFYNCIGISLACGVLYSSFGILLNPMIGALSMSISSLFVVTNALTINRFKTNEGDREMKEVSLYIPNMNCGHCQARINGVLEKIKGLENVNVLLETKQVKFSTDKEKLIKKVIKLIQKEGFEVAE